MKKVLVVYYSFSGNTKALANKIARKMNADIRELLPKKAYAFDYNTASKEVRNEIARGYCPELINGTEPISENDLIFIGTPNWFKSIAPPILSFLRQHDFGQKTVVPFCTHGGGGFGDIEKRIAEECHTCNILPGFSTSGGAKNEQISTWLNTIDVYQ